MNPFQLERTSEGRRVSGSAGSWIAADSSEKRRTRFLPRRISPVPRVHLGGSGAAGKKTKGIRISRANWTIIYVPGAVAIRVSHLGERDEVRP